MRLLKPNIKIVYKIYKLIDPTNDKVMYVGFTFNDLRQRLKSHVGAVGTSSTINWIAKLKAQGLRPRIELVEDNIRSYNRACKREMYWIDRYKLDGHALTNKNRGVFKKRDILKYKTFIS